MPDTKRVKERYISDGGRSEVVAAQVAAWRAAHPELVFCLRLKDNIRPVACEIYKRSLGFIVSNNQHRMSKGVEYERVVKSYCRGCERLK